MLLLTFSGRDYLDVIDTGFLLLIRAAYFSAVVLTRELSTLMTLVVYISLVYRL